MNGISPKTTAAVLAAALTTLVVAGLREFAGVDVGAAEQGAITTLLVFAAAYLKRDPARSVGADRAAE